MSISIPTDFPVQPIAPDDPTAKDPATCGTCGLTWDDGVSTSWTPAPSGRCPFEYFHESAEDRLEYLRTQIRAESISYGELAELQSLADSIDPGDVELLEWAGVPEHEEDEEEVEVYALALTEAEVFALASLVRQAMATHGLPTPAAQSVHAKTQELRTAAVAVRERESA